MKKKPPSTVSASEQPLTSVASQPVVAESKSAAESVNNPSGFGSFANKQQTFFGTTASTNIFALENTPASTFGTAKPESEGLFGIFKPPASAPVQKMSIKKPLSEPSFHGLVFGTAVSKLPIPLSVPASIVNDSDYFLT